MDIAEILSLPLGSIFAGDNDRQEFRDGEIRELADSISAHGLAQPIIVRPVKYKGWEIVAGERRFRAHLLLGLTRIDCIVREMDDRAAAAVMLAENFHRADLNPLDEARAYDKRRRQFGMTVSEVAQSAKISEARVRQRLRLLGLVEEAQALVRSGQLGIGYALCLDHLDVNRQRIALRAYQNTKTPTLAAFREVCGLLLAQQAQDSFLDLFQPVVMAEECRQEWAPDFPIAETLPSLAKGPSIGAILAAYLSSILAAPETQWAAPVVGRIYHDLVRMYWIRPPKIVEQPMA